MKSAQVTYLLPSGRIIGRYSSGIGQFGRRAGPRIQTAGMSPATPPWSSSSSLEASPPPPGPAPAAAGLAPGPAPPAAAAAPPRPQGRVTSREAPSSSCYSCRSSSSSVTCRRPHLVEAPMNLPHPSSSSSSLQPSGRTHLSQQLCAARPPTTAS